MSTEAIIFFAGLAIGLTFGAIGTLVLGYWFLGKDEDENSQQTQSQLTMVLSNQEEILNKMASQEQRLQAILAAVQTVKTQLTDALAQLASMQADNPANADELAALEETLGLASDAVSAPEVTEEATETEEETEE